MNIPGLPHKQGLYDPTHEKDGCGIGFVANIKGHKSHAIVQQGLQVLDNLSHRGAQGCDPCTGDGAGVLLQVPHGFLKRAAADADHGEASESRRRCSAGASKPCG